MAVRFLPRMLPWRGDGVVSGRGMGRRAELSRREPYVLVHDAIRLVYAALRAVTAAARYARYAPPSYRSETQYLLSRREPAASHASAVVFTTRNAMLPSCLHCLQPRVIFAARSILPASASPTKQGSSCPSPRTYESREESTPGLVSERKAHKAELMSHTPFHTELFREKVMLREKAFIHRHCSFTCHFPFIFEAQTGTLEIQRS